MKQKEIDKETIIKSISKMIEDKEVVRSYIKGEISIKAVNKKGIKLGKPL
jgi:hypothetical protein